MVKKKDKKEQEKAPAGVPSVEGKKTKDKKSKKSNQSNSIAGFFTKLGQSFFHPNNFLKSVESEKGYKPLLKTVVIFYFLFLMIGNSIAFYAGRINTPLFLLGIIYGILAPIVVLFILSGIIHAGVYLFKKKIDFNNTYKTIAYAIMLFLVYQFILLAVSLILPIDSTGINSIQTNPTITQDQLIQILKDFLSQPGAIINLILSLMGIIHVFVFSIKAISKFHKLDGFKSSLAIVIPWIILILFFMILSYLGGAGSIPAA